MDNRHFTPELTVRLPSKPSAAQSKVNERAPLSTYSPVAAGLTAGRTEWRDNITLIENALIVAMQSLSQI